MSVYFAAISNGDQGVEDEIPDVEPPNPVEVQGVLELGLFTRAEAEGIIRRRNLRRHLRSLGKLKQ